MFPLAVHRQGLDVPVIQSGVPQIQFIGRTDYDGIEGVFRPFWPFFALLRVVPELSASRSLGSPR